MDSLERDKLNRTLELAEENNKMLKKLVRSMRWARLVRVIYLLIIVGASIGIFYYLEPVFKQAQDTYINFKDTVNSLGGLIR